MFNSFEEVIEYFDNFYIEPSSTGIIRDCRLERMELLLAALNNPEDSFKAIHLAGSKGKGSTAAFICAALTASGEKTGLYLSPHLVDYRERFTLNGSFFSNEELISSANELEECVEHFNLGPNFGGEKPSPFELYTAYAYLLFKNTHCTYAVIETGLGGRLDATNTLHSFAQVLLPIELEHTAVLGNTIEKIAVEKSKIIKPNTQTFVSYQRMEARDVFKKEAEAQNSTIYFLDEMVSTLTSNTTKDGELVLAKTVDGQEFNLTLKMRGEVQAQNAILALLISQKLGFYQKGITEKAIEGVQLPGRFEQLTYKGKTLIIDVAHTKESVKHTASSFNSIFKNKNSNAVIYASVEGKDTLHMLSSVLDSFNKIIISKPGSFKKSDTLAIYELANSLKDRQEVYHLVDSTLALEKGLELVENDGALLIIGSFYLASSLLEVINGSKL